MPSERALSSFSRIGQLPRRDLIAISASLVGIVAVAWWYLLSLSSEMGSPLAHGMPVGDATTAVDVMPGMSVPVWNFAYFAAMFLMWAVMMVGMMLPSVAPTVLIYSLVAKQAAKKGSPVAPTGAFVSGYLAVWIGFSLVATTGQYLLDRASLLTEMMASNSNVLGGGLLLVAGGWQLAPLKDQCLQHCRSPFEFISQNWQRGLSGAVRMGVKHGIYCLGCCWAIMALLFVGGVMNLLWIAALSIFVLLEKILPGAGNSRRITGTAMIVVGIVVLI
jgi:predicted metal-binding membrane protein